MTLVVDNCYLVATTRLGLMYVIIDIYYLPTYNWQSQPPSPITLDVRTKLSPPFSNQPFRPPSFRTCLWLPLQVSFARFQLFFFSLPPSYSVLFYDSILVEAQPSLFFFSFQRKLFLVRSNGLKTVIISQLVSSPFNSIERKKSQTHICYNTVTGKGNLQ